MKYELVTVPYFDGTEITIIQGINADGVVLSIPEDPANFDYQQYLLWLEEQA